MSKCIKAEINAGTNPTQRASSAAGNSKVKARSGGSVTVTKPVQWEVETVTVMHAQKMVTFRINKRKQFGFSKFYTLTNILSS